MADEALIKILKGQGVDAWNAWRRENSEMVPNLSNAHLRKAKLPKADLSKCNLTGVDFRGADLKGAWFTNSNLNGALMQQADVSRAQFNPAYLHGVNLRRANLSRTNFDHARLLAADLTGANLREARLEGANLTWAKTSDADFANSHMAETILGDLDLSAAKGLESVLHVVPSIIDIRTIYRSRGIIPEKFLRGAGTPEDFITFMKSLVGKPIEFYSCFISYSNKDHEFAERLNVDLQSKGVRCWFAPEDLKIGDKFRTRIEESIRLYDKLMVVLSQNSIQSSWVEEEVEAALEKERQHPGTTVLFPIRLDDAVMETEQAWAASLRRTRHIGEFNNWKNHDRYKKAFDRLLRDLKAEGESRFGSQVRPRG